MVIRRGGRTLASVLRAWVVALVVTTVAVAVTGDAAAAAGGDHVRYEPPVDAPVVDGFRAPRSRFGAGNRGLTYDLAPGTPVRSSAPGRVTFAGTVAGTLHVTVLHADGLRTSYSFLDAIAVRRGQDIGAGVVVGTAGPGFHFGVRAGDAYLDPASLFRAVEIRVRLVPHDEALPPTDAGFHRERDALVPVVRDRGLLQRAWDWTRRTGADAAEGLAARIHVATGLDRSDALFEAVSAFVDGLDDPCTDDGVAVDRPGAGRTAVLVAGLGSRSSGASVDDVDTDALGYAVGDVLRYSYAGGRTPDATDHGDFAAIPARDYDPAHTWDDLRPQGRQLADLVEAVAAARPGQRVDVIAHSLGGIVARLALIELERRGRLDTVGLVVTMATPHRGADLATGAVALDDVDHDGARFVADRLGVDIDTHATSIRQLAESSPLIGELAAAGIPDGVAVRTIGATGDLVVTADKTTVDGAVSATVGHHGPHAHTVLPGSAATTRELALALAGRPPACRTWWRHVVDAAVPEAVSFAENGLIAGASL